MHAFKVKGLRADRKQIHRKEDLPKITYFSNFESYNKVEMCLSKLEICTDYHLEWVMGARDFLSI